MSIFSTASGRSVTISDSALTEAFRSASVHDDNEQMNPKLLLAKDLEHGCYELAKNEALLKKRVDRDDNSPAANTQTTKKFRPMFRPASVLLKNKPVSSSLASSAPPRNLCLDLVEESFEEEEDEAQMFLTPYSVNVAEEVKEEEKGKIHKRAQMALAPCSVNAAEEVKEENVESYFLADAKLMLGFEDDV